MAKFTYTQYSFSNGELNPKLLGRTDIKEYFNSAKEVSGFLSSTQGSLNEISGTTYIYTKDTGVSKKLDAILEFNTDAIQRSPSPRFIVGLENNIFSITDIEGQNKLWDFSLTGDTSKNFEYGTHIEINDIVIVTDKGGNYEPVVIFPGFVQDPIITSQFAIRPFSKYCSILIDKTTFNPAALIAAQAFGSIDPNNVNVAHSGSSGTIIANSGIPTFEASMVNSYLELIDGPNSYIVLITGFTSSTEISYSGTPPASGTYQFRLPDWYAGNYPKVVTFFEQRLIFSNTRRKPATIWNSEAGNICKMSYTAADKAASFTNADPFDYIAFSVDTSPVYWMVPERYLTMGTATEEFIIQKVDGVYGATVLPNITSTSKYGTYDVGLGLRAQSSTFFVERDGRTLRELSFSEENGGYVSTNIGLLGPNNSDISRIVYDYAGKRIWMQSKEGISVCTLDRASGVLAWTPLPYSGSLVSPNVIYFEDKCLELNEYTGDNFNKEYFFDTGFPGIEDTFEVPYLGVVGEQKIGIDYPFVVLTQNVIPGPTRTYEITLPNDWVDGDTTTTLVLEDGEIVTGTLKTATTNVFESPEPNKRIAFALKPRHSKSRLVTTPIQQGSPIGDSQISYQRVDKAGIRLYNALGDIKVGTSDLMDDVPLEDSFTGVKEVPLEGSPEIDHTIIVENESQKPIVILSILARGTGEEG